MESALMPPVRGRQRSATPFWMWRHLWLQSRPCAPGRSSAETESDALTKSSMATSKWTFVAPHFGHGDRGRLPEPTSGRGALHPPQRTSKPSLVFIAHHQYRVAVESR